MTTFAVIDRATGEKAFDYSSPSGLPIDWYGFTQATHDHVPMPDETAPPAPAPVDPARWRIFVGAFFDRFKTAKLAILADPDALVQAAIKDASVRTHIDLLGRRAELLQVIGLLISKGHAVDPAVVLDAEPTDDEVWHG